ncbi:MAG TPA: Gfo/Idh/MocA family oxidoreductase [Thermomicrobiales bacterium]|nr:Gfo/Idh/MocA family oxidoreductase [Thermomicrobiales bacterium]
MTLNLGLVGVNTSHADAFSRIFNGDAETPAIVEAARITHIWGGDPERVQELCAAHRIANAVDDPAAMIGHIDGALIVDDTGGGASHADLAKPFIEAGVPLFIDKPMTTNYADAVALFDLAEQHNTPIMSCSALRFPVELDRDAVAACGTLSSIVAVGPEEWFYYGVHVVELLGAVTTDRPTSVHRYALDKKDIAVVEYDTDLVAVVETLRDAGYLFHCAIFGEQGHTSFDVNDAMGFYSNEMREFAKMIETRQMPLRREQTLDVMAILHAGNRSAELGRRVLISEITGA